MRAPPARSRWAGQAWWRSAKASPVRHVGGMCWSLPREFPRAMGRRLARSRRCAREPTPGNSTLAHPWRKVARRVLGRSLRGRKHGCHNSVGCLFSDSRLTSNSLHLLARASTSSAYGTRSRIADAASCPVGLRSPPTRRLLPLRKLFAVVDRLIGPLSY